MFVDFLFFVFGEARDRTCATWFTRRVTYPLHHGIMQSFSLLLVIVLLALEKKIFQVFCYFSPDGRPPSWSCYKHSFSRCKKAKYEIWF